MHAQPAARSHSPFRLMAAFSARRKGLLFPQSWESLTPVQNLQHISLGARHIFRKSIKSVSRMRGATPSCSQVSPQHKHALHPLRKGLPLTLLLLETVVFSGYC